MQPQKRVLVMILIIIGIVFLGTLLLSKTNLCDVSIRSGRTEIVAHMAYESK